MAVDRKTLRGFGITMCFAFFIVTGLLYLYRYCAYIYVAGLSVIFLLAAIFSPWCLKHPYKLWMGLSFLLGIVMTKVILTMLFFLALTPIALLCRLFGKQFLNISEREKHGSKWVYRDRNRLIPKSRYEDQF